MTSASGVSMAPKLTTVIFMPVRPSVRYTGAGKTKGPDEAKRSRVPPKALPPTRAVVVPNRPAFRNSLRFIPMAPSPRGFPSYFNIPGSSRSVEYLQ